MHALVLLLTVVAQPLVPERIPAWRDPGDFAGASACRPCHGAIWQRWRGSPHGQAMAEPSEETVQGRFDDGWSFRLPGPDGQDKDWPVDLVLASGRTHQLYLTRTADGRYRPFPKFWASEAGVWASLQDYRPSSTDPQSPAWWGRGSLLRYSCLDCHASQASYRLTGQDGAPRIETEWVDLSINCEACHGAAKEHAAGGPPPPAMRDISAEREARLCGQCHAYKVPFDFGVDDLGIRRYAFRTPAYEGFRPDGTQLQTVYQMAGHLLSACFRRGSMKCSSCHDPHTGEARDLAGRSAEGADSHRQCTVCHRDLAGPEAAAAHTPHPPTAGCVDCHMGSAFILDSPATHQHVADHSISVPRPDEADLGGALACRRCHGDKDTAWARQALAGWGVDAQALAPRPWVAAVSKTRSGAPEAEGLLVGLLGDRAAGDHAHATALALLEALPVRPELVAVAAPWIDHPTPELRGYAVRALMRHDEGRRGAWRRRGLADPDAFVRLAAFGGEHRLADLSPAELRRAADDAAARALSPSEPVSVWVTAARSHLRRGEPALALPYLDAAARWATPEQAGFQEIGRLRWRAEGARP